MPKVKKSNNKIVFTNDELWQIYLLIENNKDSAIFGDEEDEDDCENQKQLYASALEKLEAYFRKDQ